MGDVKPQNVNIYRNAQGNLVPKYSDIGGGICLDISSRYLFQSWIKLIKEIRKTSYNLESIVENATENVPLEFKGKIALQKAYNNLKNECKRLVDFDTTPLYTFDNCSSRTISFIEKIKDKLSKALLQTKEGGPDYYITRCVSLIVDDIQKLDIKTTGTILVMNLLGNSIIDDEIFKSAGEVSSNEDGLAKVRSIIESI
jgi:hypothetical protein